MMASGYLTGLCKRYAKVVRRIERAYDPALLWDLSVKRKELHALIMNAMVSEGLEFEDR